jgi:hypothetical protein
MKKRIRKTKKIRGAGVLNRFGALWAGNKVRTFCCDSKSSDNLGFGSGTNVGKNCTMNKTGQCYPGYGFGQNYKFRCFATQTPDEYYKRYEIRERTINNPEAISTILSPDEVEKNVSDNFLIEDSDQVKMQTEKVNKLSEHCQYVAGITGKVGSTFGNIGNALAVPVSGAAYIMSSGGKKNKRSKKNRKSKPRRSYRN